MTLIVQATPYSVADDAAITAWHAAGRDLHWIARQISRTPGSVEFHMRQLGLIAAGQGVGAHEENPRMIAREGDRAFKLAMLAAPERETVVLGVVRAKPMTLRFIRRLYPEPRHSGGGSSAGLCADIGDAGSRS